MSDLLRWAWSSGVAKGYHSVNTDFTRIQKSGVSTILLKGQSYAMPPAAKSGEEGVLIVAPACGSCYTVHVCAAMPPCSTAHVVMR